jgi:hypothetical protein
MRHCGLVHHRGDRIGVEGTLALRARIASTCEGRSAAVRAAPAHLFATQPPQFLGRLAVGHGRTTG